MNRRVWVIRNRLTGTVVLRGKNQETCRRQMPLWRELLEQKGFATDLAIEIEPVHEAARQSGAI